MKCAVAVALLLFGASGVPHYKPGLRRSTRCAQVESRCLIRCEMEGAESRLRHLPYSHKEMTRCLDRCEDDLCPEREEGKFLWTEEPTNSRVQHPGAKAVPELGSGRALVAIPRNSLRVFATWRRLSRDGAASFDVLRRPAGESRWTLIAESLQTTTFTDAFTNETLRKARTYEYKVRARSGLLSGVDSRIARVVLGASRDYVELVSADLSPPIISNALFADTDGDGELEAVCWTKRTRKDGSKHYVLTIVELLTGEYREFDNAMGRPAPTFEERGWVVVEGLRRKALKEAPGSESSLWSRPRAAGDVDNDGAEEIWSTAVVDGACRYVLLKDDGETRGTISLLASVESPYPLCNGADNSRHDAFVANLDGEPGRVSLGIMGGRHEPWHIFVFDYDLFTKTLVPRWDVGSGMATKRGGTAAYANAQTSHNVAVVDVDCDGRDEIIAGGTCIDDDGTILWDTNNWFGKSAHVDGVVVDDVDPRSPGFEVVLFSETGPEYGVYRAANGYPLLEAVAPAFHIQWMIAVNVTGSEDRSLDVVGTYGGHFVDGGLSARVLDGEAQPYPFADWPREAHNWYPIDWDGRGGHQTAIFGFCFDKHEEDAGNTEHRPKVIGVRGVELFEANVNQDGHIMRAVTNAIDIVGDHREEIVVQMADGSVRAYLNTDDLSPDESHRPTTKLEDYHYRRFLAHAAFPSHVVALGRTCRNAEPFDQESSTPTVRLFEPSSTLDTLT